MKKAMPEPPTLMDALDAIKVIPADPEINGIEKILDALRPFDTKTRIRMLDYATSWACDPKTLVEDSHDGGREESG